MTFGTILDLVREAIREARTPDALAGTIEILEQELGAARVVLAAARDVAQALDLLARGEEDHHAPARPPRRASVHVDKPAPRRRGAPPPRALPAPRSKGSRAGAEDDAHPYAEIDRLIHAGTPISEIVTATGRDRHFISARVKGLWKTAPTRCRCGREGYPHRGACASAEDAA